MFSETFKFELLGKTIYLDAYHLEANGVFISLGSIFMVDLCCDNMKYTSWSDQVDLRVFVVGVENPVLIPLGGLEVTGSGTEHDHNPFVRRREIYESLDELREGEFRVVAKEIMRRVAAWQRNSQGLGLVASHAF